MSQFYNVTKSKSNISWLNRKIQHRDVESPVPVQNWANYKCLVTKSEKMCLSQNFSKIWDVSYVPEFHIYVSIRGINIFPAS